MSVRAGDIIEITVNHPSLGACTFYPKSGESGKFNYGGFRKDDDNKSVDGSGRPIRKLNRLMWSIETTVANDSVVTKEYEKASAFASSPEECDVTLTHSSGSIFSGTGSIVGDLEGDLQEGTFELKINGSGTLKQTS